MADFQLLWADEQEREIVEQLYRDWLLYGEIHMTNANGLTRLDPRGITYKPLDNAKRVVNSRTT